MVLADALLQYAGIVVFFQMVLMPISLLQSGTIINYFTLVLTFEKYSLWLSVLAKLYLLSGFLAYIAYLNI